MVWSREREAERPPLSAILPQLYLGAESDVTQDRLASLGISYVLSVSRCSPQPSFLPCSRYLRIPIDDSLWDDLLPWIPQALHFIDTAMSSGASVLVHCAAGISRSPALAVAYIMYSLGLDLDHAYRFVKERRPSISPNFNFLGQLQHFQGTLSQKTSAGQQPDKHLSSVTEGINHTYSNLNRERESSNHTGETQQRHSFPGGNQQASLAGKLRTLHLTLNQNQPQLQTPCEGTATSPCELAKPLAKPTQLQLPACPVSLQEKRKSLTLSLTPLGASAPSLTGGSHRTGEAAISKISDATSNWETRHRSEAQTCTSWSSKQPGGAGKEERPPHGKEQSLLSPLSFTLNKLLSWGERVLLGGLFVHPVRMGQPALPYSC